jgi:hypothetical protein
MPTTDLSLRLVFALDTDPQHVAGRLRDERGNEHSFSSWLGLLSLLYAVQARARPEPGEAARLVR